MSRPYLHSCWDLLTTRQISLKKGLSVTPDCPLLLKEKKELDYLKAAYLSFYWKNVDNRVKPSKL